MTWRKIWYFFYGISLAIITGLEFIDEDLLQRLEKNSFGYTIVQWVVNHTLGIVLSCTIFLAIYFIVQQLIIKRSRERRLIRNILERMNNELFGGEQELHRITLLKEIRYPKAFLKHIGAFLKHILYEKALLYIKFPTLGYYLGVYERCGCQAVKSSTMLRVDLTDDKKVVGVAGYIRYRKFMTEKIDLPDITDISNDEFARAKKINDLKTTRQRDVKEYMKQGFINDFNVLRKMHRRARHFYGTVIQKGNAIWGVLLADSTSNVSPFEDGVKERFNSFAETISGIINMGG